MDVILIMLGIIVGVGLLTMPKYPRPYLGISHTHISNEHLDKSQRDYSKIEHRLTLDQPHQSTSSLIEGF